MIIAMIAPYVINCAFFAKLYYCLAWGTSKILYVWCIMFMITFDQHDNLLQEAFQVLVHLSTLQANVQHLQTPNNKT